MEFQHLLITRLNVFYKTKMAERGFDPEVWLLERIDIFKKFCLPSIINQSNKDFVWFFYIDAETPEKQKKDLEDIFRPYSFIYLIAHTFQNFSIAKYLPSDIIEYLGSDFSYLISSRVDTDDMLHFDFVGTVQNNFNFQEYQVINFNRGFVYHVPTGVTSLTLRKSNPFVSLIEKKKSDKFLSVFHKSHTDFENDFGYSEVNLNEAIWCMTVHGLNDSTSFYGRVIKIKQPDLNYLFGFKYQKKPKGVDLWKFSKRSYRRTIIKVKVKLQSFLSK